MLIYAWADVSGFELVGLKSLKVNFVYSWWILSQWEGETPYPNGCFIQNTSPNEDKREYSFYIDVVIAFLKSYLLEFECFEFTKKL